MKLKKLKMALMLSALTLITEKTQQTNNMEVLQTVMQPKVQVQKETRIGKDHRAVPQAVILKAMTGNTGEENVDVLAAAKGHVDEAKESHQAKVSPLVLAREAEGGGKTANAKDIDCGKIINLFDQSVRIVAASVVTVHDG